ncbi:MAG: ABC transporter ATP-binding protein [Anaerolineales bacterium]|jgi:iron complex transport system ATP-binding protein
MSDLILDQVSVEYSGREGRRLALKDVSLTLQQGEVLALLGPNGSGKTTLIRAASGVLPPQRGRVCIAGDPKALHDLTPAERARRVAVVPQAAHLPGGFSVLEAVAIGRTPYLGWAGRETEKDLEQVRWAMERTNLMGLASRALDTLSGGEQQRVLIARALAQSSPILLFDEPTAHLDLRNQIEILWLIAEMAREEGKSILIALHDLNQAARIADRVALLSHGSIVSLGSPREILTAELLTRLYEIPVLVVPHPLGGIPLIVPDGAQRDLRDSSPMEREGTAVQGEDPDAQADQTLHRQGRSGHHSPDLG